MGSRAGTAVFFQGRPWVSPQCGQADNVAAVYLVNCRRGTNGEARGRGDRLIINGQGGSYNAAGIFGVSCPVGRLGSAQHFHRQGGTGRQQIVVKQGANPQWWWSINRLFGHNGKIYGYNRQKSTRNA